LEFVTPVSCCNEGTTDFSTGKVQQQTSEMTESETKVYHQKTTQETLAHEGTKCSTELFAAGTVFKANERMMTEVEDRMLLGATSEFFEPVYRIQPGTPVFILLNTKTGKFLLTGFEAASAGRRNIEANAWRDADSNLDGTGSPYPVQIRIRRVYSGQQIPYEHFKNILRSSFSEDEINHPFQTLELTQGQVERLRQLGSTLVERNGFERKSEQRNVKDSEHRRDILDQEQGETPHVDLTPAGASSNAFHGVTNMTASNDQSHSPVSSRSDETWAPTASSDNYIPGFEDSRIISKTIPHVSMTALCAADLANKAKVASRYQQSTNGNESLSDGEGSWSGDSETCASVSSGTSGGGGVIPLETQTRSTSATCDVNPRNECSHKQHEGIQMSTKLQSKQCNKKEETCESGRGVEVERNEKAGTNAHSEIASKQQQDVENPSSVLPRSLGQEEPKRISSNGDYVAYLGHINSDIKRFLQGVDGSMNVRHTDNKVDMTRYSGNDANMIWQRVQHIVSSMYGSAAVQIYGSFATGLWLPNQSDLDLLISFQRIVFPRRAANSNPNNSQSPSLQFWPQLPPMYQTMPVGLSQAYGNASNFSNYSSGTVSGCNTPRSPQQQPLTPPGNSTSTMFSFEALQQSDESVGEQRPVSEQQAGVNENSTHSSTLNSDCSGEVGNSGLKPLSEGTANQEPQGGNLKEQLGQKEATQSVGLPPPLQIPHPTLPPAYPFELTPKVEVVEIDREQMLVYLYALHSVLKLQPWCKSIDLIRSSMPVIKMVAINSTGPDLQGPEVPVDISFRTRDHYGMQARDFVLQLTEELPGVLRPLVLVLKRLLHEYTLNDVYTGGLGSYSLTNLVALFLLRCGFVAACTRAGTDDNATSPIRCQLEGNGPRSERAQSVPSMSSASLTSPSTSPVARPFRGTLSPQESPKEPSRNLELKPKPRLPIVNTSSMKPLFDKEEFDALAQADQKKLNDARDAVERATEDSRKWLAKNKVAVEQGQFDIGVLLVGILQLYSSPAMGGMDTSSVGISLEGSGKIYIPTSIPGSLHIRDPVVPSRELGGGSFQMSVVQQKFGELRKLIMTKPDSLGKLLSIDSATNHELSARPNSSATQASLSQAPHTVAPPPPPSIPEPPNSGAPPSQTSGPHPVPAAGNVSGGPPNFTAAPLQGFIYPYMSPHVIPIPMPFIPPVGGYQATQHPVPAAASFSYPGCSSQQTQLYEQAHNKNARKPYNVGASLRRGHSRNHAHNNNNKNRSSNNFQASD